jgi:hypothetical protein
MEADVCIIHRRRWAAWRGGVARGHPYVYARSRPGLGRAGRRRRRRRGALWRARPVVCAPFCSVPCGGWALTTLCGRKSQTAHRQCQSPPRVAQQSNTRHPTATPHPQSGIGSAAGHSRAIDL